jgi:hypothetical protein
MYYIACIIKVNENVDGRPQEGDARNTPGGNPNEATAEGPAAGINVVGDDFQPDQEQTAEQTAAVLLTSNINNTEN